MRKLILIATLSLLTTQAYAGGSRSLSLAAVNANPPAADAAQTVQPTVTATTTAPVSAPAAAPPSQQVVPPATTTAQPTKATVTSKPRHRREPTVEARVIRELHRHGIYW